MNTDRETNANTTDHRGLVILPYAKGSSEKIAKVLKNFKIKIAHKPIRTISNSHLKKPKDKTSKEASKGIIYNIKMQRLPLCLHQTSRALKLVSKNTPRPSQR